MTSITTQSGLSRMLAFAVRFFCLSLLVACVALVAQQPVPASGIKAARTAMAAGVEAVHRGDLDIAYRDFSCAVALAPRVSATHAALGSVLLAQNKIDRALHELDLAHKLDPSDSSVDLNLARAHVAAGRFDAAIPLFHAALSTSPAPTLNDEESLAYAQALSSTGDARTAETLIRSTLAQSPDSAQLNDALGALLAQENHTDQALPFFQHAVATDPSFARAQYHWGVALLTLDRPQEALDHLHLAAVASPTSFDIELQLGRTLSALHRDAEALSHLHRAAELRTPGNTASSLYALALALQASGDSKSALPFFESTLANPALADSSALINDAIAHVQTGDANGAFPLYARALKLGPDTATLREDFGAAYLQKLDLMHAIEQFRAGLALEPDNAHLHYDLGLALKLKDDLNAAVPEFERAAQLDPTLPDPAYALGIIYMQQGNFSAAATRLQQATALQPNNGDAWALLGSVLKDSGQPSSAADALKRAIVLQPDQPSLHIQLAALESQAGEKEAAAADRKVAADLSRAANNRQRASFALKSARALLDQNKLPEAILQLNIAAQADPDLTEAHTLLAEAYTRQGKAADAALERERADTIDRQHATAPTNP